jgi:hypothetical protein
MTLNGGMDGLCHFARISAFAPIQDYYLATHPFLSFYNEVYSENWF